AFGLRSGFWGLVDGGLDPRRIDPHDYPKGSEIMRAETLAAAFGQPFEEPRQVLARAGIEITPEAQAQVRERLRQATQAWRTEGKVKLSFERASGPRGSC